MHLRLIVLLVCVSAQLCACSREFAVDNCTACPTVDETRGNITMAVCKDRAADNEAGVTYVCRCGNFPSGAVFPSVVYFPNNQGHVTRCTNSWPTAPQRYIACMSASAIVFLYLAIHAFYVAAVSGMCSCNQRRCTKHNTSALLLGISNLFYFIYILFTIVTQQYDIAIGSRSSAEYYTAISGAYAVLQIGFAPAIGVSLALLATSMSDMVFHGEDMAGRRRCINIIFWTFIIAFMLSWLCAAFGFLVIPNVNVILVTLLLALTAALATIIGSFVLIIIAHRKMRKVRP